MEGNYSERDYDNIRNSIKSGAEFWNRLIEEKPVVDWRYYVFLFAEDSELNYYTVHYLPAVGREKNISEFVIIVASQKTGDMVRRDARIPFSLYEVSGKDREDICRFFVYFHENFMYKQILINGTSLPEDADAFKLLGHRGIAWKNFAARAALWLGEEPSEERLNAPEDEGIVSIHYKPIDWKKEEQQYFFSDADNLDFKTFAEDGVKALQLANKITPQDQLVLCTASKVTALIIDLLQGYQISAVIDNNGEKAGSTFYGIPVYHTEDFLKDEPHKDYKFIAPTRSYRAICEQLNYYGYALNRQVFVTHRSDPYDVDAALASAWENMGAGRRSYDLLWKKYPSHQIYICPYPGTGDAFLVGMYLKSMRTEHGESGGYVLVTTSGSCKKILSLFGIDAVVMDRMEAVRLLRFAKVMGFKNVKVLNDGYRPVKYENLRGCNGIDFHSLFQISIFDVREPLPFPDVPQENSDHLFLEHRLTKGKTVLLSPYANTIIPGTGESWEKIVEILTEKGYTVCTNSASPEEAAITGTTAIMIPYSQILDFLHKAGSFIGMRSGLCDIIAGAKAKKMVIYPKDKAFDKTTVFEYFSLKKMFPDVKDLMEVEIGQNDQEKLLAEVTENF